MHTSPMGSMEELVKNMRRWVGFGFVAGVVWLAVIFINGFS